MTITHKHGPMVLRMWIYGYSRNESWVSLQGIWEIFQRQKPISGRLVEIWQPHGAAISGENSTTYILGTLLSLIVMTVVIPRALFTSWQITFSSKFPPVPLHPLLLSICLAAFIQRGCTESRPASPIDGLVITFLARIRGREEGG